MFIYPIAPRIMTPDIQIRDVLWSIHQWVLYEPVAVFYNKLSDTQEASMKIWDVEGCDPEICEDSNTVAEPTRGKKIRCFSTCLLMLDVLLTMLAVSQDGSVGPDWCISAARGRTAMRFWTNITGWWILVVPWLSFRDSFVCIEISPHIFDNYPKFCTDIANCIHFSSAVKQTVPL